MIDKNHLLMLTVAALAMEWVTRPECWDEFSAGLRHAAPGGAELTRDMAVDLSDHLAEHVFSSSIDLIAEAN